MVLLFIAPSVTYAFSFSDLFWWRNDVVEEQNTVELNAKQKVTAQQKLTAWINAYNKKDLALVSNNEDYTTMSEEELNYILQEQLKEYDNAPIQDVSIKLDDNKIILEGYALKPFKGNVYIELRVEVMEEKLYFYISKAKYMGFPVPGSLIGRLIYGHLEPISNFFFNDENNKLQDIITDKDLIKFVFE